MDLRNRHLVVGNHSSRLTFDTITKQEIRMSSTCSVLPRDLVSVEVAAQQVGPPPSDLVDQVHVSGAYASPPERGPDGKRQNLGISVRPGHPAQAATLPAIPRPPPSGAQDDRWFVGEPLGLDTAAMDWHPIRGWIKPLHERGMKADSMPERLLIGPGSPPSIDPVYPELPPPA